MSAKILLYDSYQVQEQPKQINLTNPTFSGGNGWSVTGAWTFGSDYAFTNSYGRLLQDFGSPMDPTLNYRINFEIQDRVSGTLLVRLTSDQIAQVSANGSFSIPYRVSGATPVDISFRTSLDVFEGKVKNVRIVQDTELSPLASRTEWREKSFLELNDGEAVALNYKITDARSLTNRFGSFSKSFSLPASPLNRRSLGYLEANEWTPEHTFDPRRINKAVLFVNDEVAFEGFLSLKGIEVQNSETTFEVELYDNPFGLLDAIRGKNITDLDLGGLQHKLTLDNVLASWSTGRTWTDGWIYPLYLTLSENDRAIATDFTPAYYNRWILDKIITEAGFTYEISPYAESKINRMLTAPVGKKPNAATQDVTAAKVLVHNPSDQTISHHGSTIPPTLGERRSRFILSEEDIDANDQWNDTNYTYTAPFTGQYELTFNWDSTIQFNQIYNGIGDNTVDGGDFASSYVGFELCDVSNGAILSYPGRWEFPDTTHGNTTFQFSGSGFTQVTLQAGQKVAITQVISNHTIYRTRIFGGSYQIGTDITFTVHGNTSLAIDPSAAGWTVGERMSVDASAFLPRVSQEAFLTDHFKA